MESEYKRVEENSPRPSFDKSSSDNDTLLEAKREIASSRSLSRSFWRQHYLAICTHLSIFIIYTTLAQVLIAVNPLWQRLFAHQVQTQAPYLHSPANEIVEWRLQEFDSVDDYTGPLSGYPRPELEKAWEDLIGNMNIRMSYDDLKAFGRQENAVALADGSGYVGTLSVYHEMHCVKRLHMNMYQEYYWPELDDAKREENRLHSEHCLSMLRKSAMCHGDVGIITYQWKDFNSKPDANGTAHKCINWKRLVEWTAERTVDMFAPGIISHPRLGR